MEAAAFCAGKVASVTVIGRSEVPFENTLGKAVGKSIGNFFESKGVKVIGNANVEKFVGESNSLTGVVLNGETIPADICIVGLGIAYDTKFLTGSDVKLTGHGAIEVDEVRKKLTMFTFFRPKFFVFYSYSINTSIYKRVIRMYLLVEMSRMLLSIQIREKRVTLVTGNSRSITVAERRWAC